ncbi:MAG: hypothetical protein FWD23_06525 [Oscillospiraceae bacterium]|nr:hypothetical protein [Oscillospiraceae bacterium]
MFEIISKIIDKIKNQIKKNDEDNPEYRIKFAHRIANKKIKYVTERTFDVQTGEVSETVIGKNGFFNINKNNEISVYCGGDELFRAYVPELKAYEFLSLEGAVMEAFDLISGKFKNIITYYIYHRR